MNQLFKVGELVSINVNAKGGYRGLAVIIEVLDDIERLGNTGKVSGGICYRINKDSGLYDQSVILKHYPPSTKTFAEIMEGLKRPVVS